MLVRLGTHIADPVAERLRFVQSKPRPPTRSRAAMGMRDQAELEPAPAATLAVTSKLLGHRRQRRRAAACRRRTARSPTCRAARPQFLCGARATYFSALMPIADGMGLVFAVTSYDGGSSSRRPRAAS